MEIFESTKIIELGSCAFRQPLAESRCRYLHGYRLYAKFWFGCKSLDARNWVVDFGGLKRLKQNLEAQFDHTTCIAEDDPALKHFEKLYKDGLIDLRVHSDGVGIEKFAQLCHKMANQELALMEQSERCWCYKVEVWEHEKNSACFIQQPVRDFA